MSNVTFHIPRRSEIALALPTGKQGKADPKPYIERALDSDKLMATIEPYLVNGGKSAAPGEKGGWRIDNVRVADAIAAYDKANGNGIAATGVSDVELLSQVNVVLRRRYKLVDHKIVGLSDKWMLTAKPTE